jgi:hypothetical protein
MTKSKSNKKNKYRLIGVVVVGSKYLGEIIANSEKEAYDRAWKELDCYVSLCHHCSKHLSDLEVEDINIESVEEINE